MTCDIDLARSTFASSILTLPGDDKGLAPEELEVAEAADAEVERGGLAQLQ